jgi:hypothetical protein
MEDLKEHWIREVEEVVDADTKPFSKDDDEADLIDHEPEFDPSNANVTSFVGGAFESNNATPQVSYDLVFDNTTVDTIDPVNFNTPPFTSALDIHSFNGYDLASQATGMSDFAAQQFGDDNMYQQAFDDSHFLPQQHQLVVQQDTAYWGSV